jgi:hypothetical protein
MRYQLPLLRRRLGGADLQAAVNGHGVTADDLTVEAPAERDGERGFAATGRAQDDDKKRLRCLLYQTLHHPGGKRSCKEERPKPVSRRMTATTNRP